MKAPKKTLRRSGGGGSERFLLGLALLVPLGVLFLALTQLPATSLASWSLTRADANVDITSKRPVSSNPAPPPTLAPPAATPKPTATPVPLTLAANAATTPRTGGSYIVQPGDELKQIAADYNVSIWKIINANDIADPDSLRIGQVLRIPSE